MGADKLPRLAVLPFEDLKFRPKFVLVDLGMLEMDSKHVAQAIRRLGSALQGWTETVRGAGLGGELRSCLS